MKTTWEPANTKILKDKVLANSVGDVAALMEEIRENGFLIPC